MGEILSAVGLPTTATHARAVLVADEVTEGVHRTAAAQSVETDVMSTQQVREARAAGRLEGTVLLPVREDHRYHHDYVRSQMAAFAYADVDFTAKNGLETPTASGRRTTSSRSAEPRIRIAARSGQHRRPHSAGRRPARSPAAASVSTRSACSPDRSGSRCAAGSSRSRGRPSRY